MTGLLEAWAARELQAEPDVRLFEGDCFEVLKGIADNSVDACVTDPPYHLTSIVKRFGGANAAPAKEGTDGAFKRASRGFMGRTWDGGDIAFQPELWAEVLRVLKPGGYVAAFASTRGFGSMSVAIEDAGFITHPLVAWIFSTGFPKATRIDAEGYENFRYGRQALKPAIEPIYVGQKPFSEKTGTANVLRWGTGAINIGACRVGVEVRHAAFTSLAPCSGNRLGDAGTAAARRGTQGEAKEYVGRWPANVAHDGSDEALAAFPNTKSGVKAGGQYARKTGVHEGGQRADGISCFGDSGSAARFFFAAQRDEDELLFWQAKTILTAWNQELANTADSHSCLSKNLVASALSAVAILASRGANVPCLIDEWTVPSTSVTPVELRMLCESAIIRILNLGADRLRDLRQEENTKLISAASGVGPNAQIGIMTITISHWRSDGSAEPVTFSIMSSSTEPGDLGSAKRFMYCAKANKTDRAGSKHPTVKPVALIRWLCRLVTPPGGVVLDPFAGSGTTGQAARDEGFTSVLIEREAEYIADIKRRLGL